MPLKMLYALMQGILYPIAYYVVGYRKKVVRKNIALAFPEKNEKDRKILEKKFYHWFADLIAEIIYGYRISEEEIRERVVFDNLNDIETTIKEHGGTLFMLAHMGCWEWIADVAKRFVDKDIHEHAVYRELKNKNANKAMLELRNKRGGDCIEKNSLIRKMVLLRKEKGAQTYGMLSDQKPSKNNLDCWVPFLNMEVPFITGSEVLGRKFNYPVYYARITMPKRGYYHIHLEELSTQPALTEDGEITKKYAEKLENNIKLQPHIWLWTHNRFKWHRALKQNTKDNTSKSHEV